jgi:hypothetical protein
MKNFLLIIIGMSSTICISQNDKKDLKNREFTTHEIDSICTNGQNNGKIISEGVIRGEMQISGSKKTKLISGNGGFSYTLYPFHYNEAYYNTLTNKEQNKYNFDKNSRLIKGEYHNGIAYKNSYREVINSEFYYFNDSLFHVKIKIERTQKNKQDQSEIFDLNISDLNDPKPIKNIFLMEIKSWINEQNNKIIDIYRKSLR